MCADLHQCSCTFLWHVYQPTVTYNYHFELYVLLHLSSVVQII